MASAQASALQASALQASALPLLLALALALNIASGIGPSQKGWGLMLGTLRQNAKLYFVPADATSASVPAEPSLHRQLRAKCQWMHTETYKHSATYTGHCGQAQETTASAESLVLLSLAKLSKTKLFSKSLVFLSLARLRKTKLFEKA